MEDMGNYGYTLFRTIPGNLYAIVQQSLSNYLTIYTLWCNHL
ncbi:hypothetical protein HMPREF9431_01420 [Segatella oulorum F0390]|uniref:Uncharacterized protein n=1 Tax=Segatella oulorum F0390 TaxID=702438 RepID=G1WC69_9BACT|nr:hypothetical protein HMPREF9431_01420 [Segatella oulorum F0390]